MKAALTPVNNTKPAVTETVTATNPFQLLQEKPQSNPLGYLTRQIVQKKAAGASQLKAPRTRAMAISGVVQRVPVQVENTTYFDGNVPAFLELVKDFKERQAFGIKGKDELVFFEPLTGLYYNKPEKGAVLPPESLAPETTAASMDIEEVNSKLALVYQAVELEPPGVSEIPATEVAGAASQYLLLKVVIPDLLQIIKEGEGKHLFKNPVSRFGIGLLIQRCMQLPATESAVLHLLCMQLTTVSDLLLAKMPPGKPDELIRLAQDHKIQNDQKVIAESKEKAENDFGGVLDATATPEARAAMLKDAFIYGVNVDGIVKRVRIKTEKEKVEKKKNDAIITELTKATKELEKKYKGMLGNDSKWPGFKQILEKLTAKGLSYEEINAIRKARGKKLKVDDAEAEAKELLNLHYGLHRPAPVKLDPGHFQAQEGLYTSSVIDPMLLHAVDRAKKQGNTLPENGYIERHFTAAVMSYLAANPSIYIDIYEGHTSQALGDLAAMGYVSIFPFAGNDNTDFQQFTAISQSGQATFVVVGLSGLAYQREIAAHFLYYNPPINPLRIHHKKLAAKEAAVGEFTSTLQLLPKGKKIIVQMGNVEQVKRGLAEKKIVPTGEIVAPNLYGQVYDYHNNILVSLRVEPFLYADRAGAFLKAIQKEYTDGVTVIFTGTAGALDGRFKVGDLVAPASLNQVDTVTGETVDKKNLGSDFIKDKYGGREAEGMFSGVTHGAVDSILFEDNIWFKQYGKQLALVEQEVGHLAKAAAEAGEKTKLYAVFRISDILGEKDFTKEGVRPKYRTPVQQGELVIQILEKEFPAPPVVVQEPVVGQSEGPPQQQVVLLQQVQAKKLVFEKKEAVLELQLKEGVIALSAAVVDMMKQVDPKLAKSFSDNLDNIAEAAAKLAPQQLLTQLSKLFQLYNVSISNLTFKEKVVNE